MWWLAGDSTALNDEEGLACGRGSHLSAEGRAGPSGWRVARPSPPWSPAHRTCYRDGRGDRLGRGRDRGAAVGVSAGRGRPPSVLALAAHRTYAELLGRRSGLAAVAEAPSTQLDERRGGRARRRRPWSSATAAGSSQGWWPAFRTRTTSRGCAVRPDGARLGFNEGRVVSVQFQRTPAEQLSASAKASERWLPRSFRWSFPQAKPDTTERHQEDDTPDLSRADGTGQCPIDGRGPTSNP